ncbi:histidinol dehydrogenase [Marinomonas sp. SBI22]|uniref:histidinol dehydrogenase n=1 Tax=unclassified Marinomonas TaxID=196814 RepID=UPI0007AFB5F1|nr:MULTISPECIES: histidinol dehydrogenase [unclassified Marinomonas]KZM44912.1 histidinol dehydrogenase [Marinomonas sp. SBI22]KZM46611.1 histidinol dehydrogenase [Marinomonas sp. SBI8L]
MQNINLWQLDELDSAKRQSLLMRTEADLSLYIDQVRPIIERVKKEGDLALIEYTKKFDGASLSLETIQVTEQEFLDAQAQVDEDTLAAIKYASNNIRQYHEAQKPQEMVMQEVRSGSYVGEKYLAIPSVACYVPRGKGSFPSVLMMNAIPAVVAGVEQVVILTPPGPDGRVDAATLVAAKENGINQVYKCGGAQAVAAVAYGTDTLPKCSKIVGPGSPWMIAAKQELASLIDPGIPAGPSESIVFADDSVDGALAAMDLLIEAEHGPDSSAYLVTTSSRVAQEALSAIPQHWLAMSELRVEYSKTVLTGPMGGIILADNIEQAFDFINDYAPEHLQILSQDAWKYLGKIRNAGEVLLGQHSPSTLGNFVLGCNAVLPTSGAAATVSPLSVMDFMKFMSVAYVTQCGYPEMAKHAHVLASYEGFDAHANAVSDKRKSLIK